MGRREARSLPSPKTGKARFVVTPCYDSSGNYCVRYLHSGIYTLFARFSDEGWARVDNIKVASNVTDLGERPLARGGTIDDVSEKSPLNSIFGATCCKI